MNLNLIRLKPEKHSSWSPANFSTGYVPESSTSLMGTRVERMRFCTWFKRFEDLTVSLKVVCKTDLKKRARLFAYNKSFNHAGRGFL